MATLLHAVWIIPVQYWRTTWSQRLEAKPENTLRGRVGNPTGCCASRRSLWVPYIHARHRCSEQMLELLQLSLSHCSLCPALLLLFINWLQFCASPSFHGCDLKAKSILSSPQHSFSSCFTRERALPRQIWHQARGHRGFLLLLNCRALRVMESKRNPNTTVKSKITEIWARELI